MLYEVNLRGTELRTSEYIFAQDVNIDAISAGPTENPEYTRLTIVSTGDEYMKDQVVRQLYKLYDVKTVAFWNRSIHYLPSICL